MTTKSQTAKTETFVADICLYGTHDANVGAGYLGQIAADSRLFGTGEPRFGRTFTEAVWMAVGELSAHGVVAGKARVFAPGGEKMAVIELDKIVPYFGNLPWQAAPVYTISADAIMSAAEPR